MPTYEYNCPKCGTSFEKFQSMTSEPFADCSSCGEKKIRRSITSGQGVIFKGSGFYVTDYKKDGKQDNNSDNNSKKSTENQSNSKNSENKEKKSSQPKTKD